jgi:hypothetical protein
MSLDLKRGAIRVTRRGGGFLLPEPIKPRLHPWSPQNFSMEKGFFEQILGHIAPSQRSQVFF